MSPTVTRVHRALATCTYLKPIVLPTYAGILAAVHLRSLSHYPVAKWAPEQINRIYQPRVVTLQ